MMHAVVDYCGKFMLVKPRAISPTPGDRSNGCHTTGYEADPHWPPQELYLQRRSCADTPSDESRTRSRTDVPQYY